MPELTERRPLTELLDQLEWLVDGARDRAAVNLLRPMVEALRAAEALITVNTLHDDEGEEYCAMCLYPTDRPDTEFCETCDLRARLSALRDAAALELEEKK